MPEDERRAVAGIEERVYGKTAVGQTVTEYALTNAQGASVRILTYGGIVTELYVPDRDGHLANVVLGRPSLAAYEAKNPYFGALIGRFANRIAGGVFELDGVSYRLPLNQGPNHLHGGARGFDRRLWRGEPARDPDGPSLTLRYTSADGEEGYPGTLDVIAKYVWTDDAVLRVSFEATTDAPTIVSLTNHSYFNLAGEDSGTICDHVLTVDAESYTPVDQALIPTGEIAPVGGTPFDLRAGARLGQMIRTAHPQIEIARGFDHNFTLVGWDASGRRRAADLRRAARLEDPRSGRTLEIHTVEPGIQVYTGNALDGTLTGTSGGNYRQGDGIALETQNFPDAPNQPGFPDAVLRPGETYRSVTEYRFGVED
jgi:aldose 1-epimerase